MLEMAGRPLPERTQLARPARSGRLKLSAAPFQMFKCVQTDILYAASLSPSGWPAVVTRRRFLWGDSSVTPPCHPQTQNVSVLQTSPSGTFPLLSPALHPPRSVFGVWVFTTLFC